MHAISTLNTWLLALDLQPGGRKSAQLKGPTVLYPGSTVLGTAVPGAPTGSRQTRAQK